MLIFEVSYCPMNNNNTYTQASFNVFLDSLRSLDLTNCSITDNGILHLPSLLPQLNELILTNTPLTSRGIIAMFSGTC